MPLTRVLPLPVPGGPYRPRHLRAVGRRGLHRGCHPGAPGAQPAATGCTACTAAMHGAAQQGRAGLARRGAIPARCAAPGARRGATPARCAAPGAAPPQPPRVASSALLVCLHGERRCRVPTPPPPTHTHTHTHPTPPPQVLGDRLHCVFVDNGLLRYKEAERVMDTFNQHLHLPVTKVDDAGAAGAAPRATRNVRRAALRVACWTTSTPAHTYGPHRLACLLYLRHCCARRDRCTRCPFGEWHRSPNPFAPRPFAPRPRRAHAEPAQGPDRPGGQAESHWRGVHRRVQASVQLAAWLPDALGGLGRTGLCLAPLRAFQRYLGPPPWRLPSCVPWGHAVVPVRLPAATTRTSLSRSWGTSRASWCRCGAPPPLPATRLTSCMPACSPSRPLPVASQSSGTPWRLCCCGCLNDAIHPR